MNHTGLWPNSQIQLASLQSFAVFFLLERLFASLLKALNVNAAVKYVLHCTDDDVVELYFA